MRVYRLRPPRLRWAGVVVMLVAAACTRTDAPVPDTTTAPTSQPTTTTLLPIVLGPGIDEGVIRLGVLLPLTGQLALLGEDVRQGHETYWAYVNRELGGLDGFEVEVIASDSQYLPEVAAAAADQLASETLTISSTLGSSMTEAVLPLAASKDLLVGAGAQIHAWGADPLVLLDLALPTYRDQVRIGLDWAVTSGGVSTGAVAGLIAQEGLYGDDCADGFLQGVADTALTLGPQLRHGIAQTEFSAEITVARDDGVEVLIVCSLPEGLLAMVGTAELLDYRPLMIATTASYNAEIPAALGGDEGEGAGLARLNNLVVLGAIEEAEDASAGLRLYQDNLARAQLSARDESWYAYLGYTQAATMHLVLQAAFEARDVSRIGLRKAADTLQPVDFGFGAGPVGFDDGVPTAVDAVGRPRAAGESLFGLERVSDFILLTD